MKKSTTTNKTFKYSVSFTIETARRLKIKDLEEKITSIWDDAYYDRKLFVDSYDFNVVEED